MSNSPFEGTDSPYGPAGSAAAAATTVPAAPGPPVPPLPYVPPTGPAGESPATPGLGLTAGLPASGYGPPPAYQPYATAPRAAPRLVNPLGSWSLGLGISAFVSSVGSLATNTLSSILGLTAVALGILALVVARGGVRPRAGAIWGICLAALPVLVAALRLVGEMLASLR